VRGVGRVGTASLNALISYYGVSVPAGYLFTFVLGGGRAGKPGMGLHGLWYGMFSGQLLLCIIYQFFISFKFDWDEIVRESR
jgi:Na+-driven multidrug efflux pump